MTVKKLTITVDEDVYRALHEKVGRRKISRFVNDLVRPHVLRPDLMEDYRAMAADELHEAEANAWVQGTQGGTWDDTP